MPMVEAGDYQMAALYWYPITEFELVKNHMDEDWDYIAPLFATIHHIYMVFVCCFIGLSMVCGLMIFYHLPSWKIPFLQWFRSASTLIAAIYSGTFRIIQYIYASSESILARCLDSILTDSPLWLIGTSTGLILGDILLAMWTANQFFPARSRNQFNTTESWNVSSKMPRRSPVLTWHFGNPDVPGFGLKVVDLIRISLQSYPARFAHWYNNQHELDEMHHYPALTGTIMFIIVCLGFNWIWEDKPQRLRQVEHTIEETLLKNAITHDFEDYLRKRSSRTDGWKAFMDSNVKVIRDIIAHNKTLRGQYQFVTAQADTLQVNLTDRAQQLDTCRRDTIDLRRVNTYLQTEVNRLRSSADVQTHTASMEALNAQLASANDENINLQQQLDNLHQELEVVREARATAAERASRMAVTERSALSADVERLEQRNAELQESSEQQIALEREKAAVEAAELRSRNDAMAAHAQFLQGRLDMQEASFAERTRVEKEAAWGLQAKLVALQSNLDSKSRDLEKLLAREEQTRAMAREREDQADRYKKGYELLEKRLVDLDQNLKDSMQTIHDPRKKDEIGQLRRQLEKLQARYTVLEDENKALQETNNQLERKLAGQKSASTERSRADSDETVRLRTELTHANETIRRLEIQKSNLEAQLGGSGSGDPFIRKQSRGSRGPRGERGGRGGRRG